MVSRNGISTNNFKLIMTQVVETFVFIKHFTICIFRRVLVPGKTPLCTIIDYNLTIPCLSQGGYNYKRYPQVHLPDLSRSETDENNVF